MSVKKQIEPREVREIMLKVQRYHALETIRNIIAANPDCIDEFGLDDRDFQNVEMDISESERDCQDWWDKIAEKYHLPQNSKFQLDYESCILEII